jgi:hypothetical protein
MNEIEIELNNINDKENKKGNLFYNRKFLNCYNNVRKSLVLIKKNKKLLGSQECCRLTHEVLIKSDASLVAE